MITKKSIASSIALAAIGVASAVSTASAGVECRIPGSDNSFLNGIATPIRVSCNDNPVTLSATASATATASSVSVILITGDTAVSGGRDAGRLNIAGCQATDSTPGGAGVTDPCVGTVVFHDLFVANN
jgi:hypothetical protein